MSEPRDHDPAGVTESEQPPDRTESAEPTATRLDELERRVTELEATTQALRGYVGGVRAVEADVERRANAALAAVNRLEAAGDRATDTVGIDGATETVGIDGATETVGIDGATETVGIDEETTGHETPADDRPTDRLREWL